MNLTPVASPRGHFGRVALTVARGAIFGALAFLAACQSSQTDVFTTTPLRPAQTILDEGIAAFTENNYRVAIAAFVELDRSYPYSELARQGLALLMTSYYRTSNYDAAIETAERYMLLYPSTADAALVLYLQGESYMRQVPDITRNQANAGDALDAFQLLITRFPQSEWVDPARRNMVAIRDQLAGQEMLVGRYYLERREYVAAVNRFIAVVRDYQDTRHVEEALFRLTEAYVAMGLLGEAQTAAAILGHNFPNSEWYQDAYDLLASLGLAPVRNEGGALAGLFR
jgi:outer membrane protein assembly factor BamD